MRGGGSVLGELARVRTEGGGIMKGEVRSKKDRSNGRRGVEGAAVGKWAAGAK